jgi:hypothetical protein
LFLKYVPLIIIKYFGFHNVEIVSISITPIVTALTKHVILWMVHVLLVDVNVDTKGITVVQVRNTDSLLSFSACIHNDNRCNRYGNNFHIMETKIFNDIYMTFSACTIHRITCLVNAVTITRTLISKCSRCTCCKMNVFSVYIW